MSDDDFTTMHEMLKEALGNASGDHPEFGRFKQDVQDVMDEVRRRSDLS